MSANKRLKIKILQNTVMEGSKEGLENMPYGVVVERGEDETPVFSDTSSEDQAYFEKYVVPYSKELRNQKKSKKSEKRQLEDLILMCATFDDEANHEYREVINLCRKLSNKIFPARGEKKIQKNNPVLTESISNELQVQREKCKQKHVASKSEKANCEISVRRSSRISTPPVRSTLCVGYFIMPPSTTEKKLAQKRKNRSLPSPSTTILSPTSNLTNTPEQSSASLIKSHSCKTKRKLYSEETWINSKEFESMWMEYSDCREGTLQK